MGKCRVSADFRGSYGPRQCYSKRRPRGKRDEVGSDSGPAADTRVRFARLTWIRRILGGKPDEVEAPHDASSFVEDDEYLILDLVLNWVSLGDSPGVRVRLPSLSSSGCRRYAAGVFPCDP